MRPHDRSTLRRLARARGDVIAGAGRRHVPAGAWCAGLGVAGSLVASVDDGSALYENPAGLADIDGIGALIDLGVVMQRVGYDRIDSGGNPQPHVDGDMNLLPIPTLAVSWKPPRERRLTIAGGVWTPYLGVNSWPEDGPQRYSNVSLNGSVLAVAELAAAYRVTDELSLGIGIEDMIVDFRSRIVLSACTELNCAPEDRGFDAVTEVRTTSAFTPSAVVGGTLALAGVRAGLAVQLPFFVRSSGTVRSRLPSDPQYASAVQVGDRVSLDFDLPLVVRLGASTHLRPGLSAELGIDYEAWSMQKAITLQPHGIRIDGVPGVGSYELHSLSIARDMRDTFSAHLGGEWQAIPDKLVVRAGYLLETSATPDRTASVLTPDGFHNLVAAGVGLWLGTLRLDLGYGHLFTSGRTIRDSQALQLNPVQPALAVPVGNGKYTFATDIVSAGVSARL